MNLSDVIPRGQYGLKGIVGLKGDTGASADEPIVWPSGVILFWSGTLVNIPNGWVLCDGNNGTPDLRSKFVKGAASGQNPGSTGGAATHSHSDHAARTHSGFAISDHSALTHSGFDPGGSHGLVYPYVYSYGQYPGYGPSHSTTQPSQHAARSHSVTQPSSHSARTHSTDNHEPAYFKLAYIMKT